MAVVPSLGFDFVYDDLYFVVQNPRLENAAIADFFVDPTTLAGTPDYEGTYRPLRTLSFALDRRLFGPGPVAPHAWGIVLHAACTMLLFALLAELLPGGAAAFLASLLFAVHPMAAEAAAWVSSRDGGLYLAFFLGALLLHRRARARALYGALAVASFSLALLSKEMAITFPLIVAAHDRVFSDRAPEGRLRAALWLAYVLVAAGYLGLRFAVLGPSFGQRSIGWGDSAATSVLSAVTACGFQLMRCVAPFLPQPFTFDYQLALTTTPFDLRFLASAAALATLITLGATAWLNRSKAALFLLWFPVTILPVSNLLVPINILVADRFLYGPAIGPLVGLAAALVALERRFPVVGRGVAGAWVLAFAVSLGSVLPAWKNAEALWSRAVTTFPGNPRALHGLATARRLDGDLLSARDLAVRAVAAEPSYWPAYGEGLAVTEQLRDWAGLRDFAIAWIDAAAARRPEEAAAIAEGCVPAVMILVTAGRAADAADVARRLAGAGAASEKAACAIATALEAVGATGEARRYRERCEAGRARGH